MAASDRQRKVVPAKKGDAAGTIPDPGPLHPLTAADVVLGDYADAGLSKKPLLAARSICYDCVHSWS